MTEAENILRILSRLRVPPQPEEYEIHHMISEILTKSRIEFIHEYRLAPGRRIDFRCGRVGIEVKKGRPEAKVLQKQLERYLESSDIDTVIVVMQQQCRLPSAILGKPVYLLSLNRLWGVALP